MKKLFKRNIVLVVAAITAAISPILIGTFTVTAPVAMTGCVTGPIGTNDQAAIDATALILQNSARAGALAAITPPTGNTNNAVYFDLAAQVIGTFLTGKDYSPAAFQQALVNIKIPQATNVWVQLGIGAVIDLYQVYFSQYVRGQVNGNAYAGQFLKAIQDGFNQALGKPVSLTVPSSLKLSSRPLVTPQIVPRPLKQ